MKRLLGAAVLLNRHTGEIEPAQIFSGCDEANRRHYEEVWKPELLRRSADFTNWDESATGNAQDSHWGWDEIMTSSLSYESFVIECGGVMQGLMNVNVATKFARLPPHNGRELAYIDRVATAPWNRHKFTETPKYKGVGRALFATSVSLSFELEFRGRIGLHALEQSETWYQELGLTDCGFDEAEGMRYFEMTEEQAIEFLKGAEV
ncbi:hypothetical protein IVA93_34570 [Bradyrhizobium sp. 155]|uniref:hypothetical protein n=1 Tax=unclassified Bradyrhizobium TaxID=2631580 RepID=UPI001FF9B7F2|nr:MULTISPECIES: hypothetical protein [unclassified Bradyrhizobium]MCK1704510.1 hypothetical protein [Bradyrhizobium sp. 146]UPK11227.1 hypothetical protein IVA93_34570 [Bradyrhizobium sp. 155]